MTLSHTEMFEQNLALTKQRLLQEAKYPEIFEWIPQNARIINLPKDNPEHLRANLELAVKLVQDKNRQSVVLIPQPGFETPWHELIPIVSGKRIVDIQSIQGGAGLGLIFDDGSQLMLVAMKQTGHTGTEQLAISIGMRQDVPA
jgi:hypothetical protein